MAKNNLRYPRTIQSLSKRNVRASAVHFGDYIEVTVETSQGVAYEEFTPDQEKQAKAHLRALVEAAE